MREEVIGNARLILGDAAEVVTQLSGIDLVITDPPYSSGARTDSERQQRGSMLRSMEDDDWFSHDSMTTWGYNWFLRPLLSTMRHKMSQGGHAYMFTDWRMTPTIYGMMEATGFRVNHCLVWKKPHFGMGAYWRNQHENIVFASNGQPNAMLDRGKGSVVECSAVSSSARVHPTEKPVDLLIELIDAVPGNVVFDPFMGSGGTGVAAIRSGRSFIGCEINPHHFETSIRRIEAAQRQADLFVSTASAPQPEARTPDMFAEIAP